MTTAKYSTFTEQVSSAFRLLRFHKVTAIKLALLPLVPFAFTLPYLIDLANYNQYNLTPSLQGVTLVFFVVALIAAITFLILCEIVKAGLYAVFSTTKAIGARKALQIGTQRFPAFLFTEIILAVFVFVSLIPVLILNFWSGVLGTEMLAQFMPLAVAELLVLIVAIIFLIPVFIIGIWLSFAQLLASIDNKMGLTALTHSVTLIRPNFKPIALRLVGWTVFVLVASYIVQPLPLAYWLVPAILMLLGVAFLVVLYQETIGQRSSGLSEKSDKTGVSRRISTPSQRKPISV